MSSDRDTHDAMQAALDKQLIRALEGDEPASAAIITAGIKRLEQLAKDLATDPRDDMAAKIEELRQQDRIIPEVDLHDDDPATDDRY